MYQVNNKFARHGRYTPAFCESLTEAETVRKYIAQYISGLFGRFESGGEWVQMSTGRKYAPQENGYLRVGDAAYWEWYDRVIADVRDDGVIPEDVLMRHCMAAVEITETDRCE